MKKLLMGLVVLSPALVGCSSPQVMSAEFSTMDSCLASIKANSGKQLEIVTDKLGDISGFLAGTKLGFACQTESTGTRGLVVKGWYHIEK